MAEQNQTSLEAVEYAKSHKKEFIDRVIQDKVAEVDKVAIYMAGTPGAGKTEVATSLNEMLGADLVMIDADAFRESFPAYNGTNSSDFQRAASLLVDKTYDYVMKHGYSFILDGTFAYNNAIKNIERAVKRNYDVAIYFVYQKPDVAWRFTKIREAKQGRVITKEAFIRAYLQSQHNVEAAKQEFGDRIMVNLVFKDFENAISDIVMDVENIGLLLSHQYTENELEELLND
ncbi:MAG: zeta toxin family protein [Lactobacillaceae bacterium]|jgi:predicted ABC-type ATPase|nr:zeta toxin family protein [Lactobacillaceae bacterium]